MTRILIVEDDSSVGPLTGRFLKAEGYDYKLVTNGRKALEVIAEYDPHVVTIDNNMPEMGGEEIIPILRRDCPGIKLIATGQKFTPEALNMCDEVVVKPYGPTELYVALEKTLSK